MFLPSLCCVMLQLNASVREDGGAPVHFLFEYARYRGPTADHEWHLFANTSSGTVLKGKLLPRRWYTFRAEAVNVAGTSGVSDALVVQTKYASPPSPPVTINSSSTGGAVTIQWTDPVDAGGVEILSYVVVFDGEYYDLDADARRFVRPQLARNSSFVFNVTAVNAVGGRNGVGEPSADMVATTFVNATEPTPPTELRVHSEDVGWVVLEWTPPFDSGGVSITGYTVFRRLADGPGDAAAWTELGQVGGGVTSLMSTVRGDEVYWFTVIANTTWGPSDPAELFEYTSVFYVPPSPPLGLHNISVATGGGIKLAWNTPSDDGADDIRGYLVETNRGGVWTTVTGQALQRPHTYSWFHLALPANTSVAVRVRAVNRLVGPPSAEFNVSTTRATPPAQPLGVRVTHTTGGTVGVEWRAPADTGGVPLHQYVVSLSVGMPRTILAADVTQVRLESVDGFEYNVEAVVFVINKLRWGAVVLASLAVSGPIRLTCARRAW